MQLWMSAESSLHRRGSLPIFPKVDNKATKRPTDLSAVPAPDYNQSKMLQTVAEDNFRLRQIIRLCDWLHDHPQDETTPPNVIFERIGTLKSMLHPPFEASARA
ncbi:hypothetical protein PUNSTDRAFT_52807, partial [Punctularia strigosozonata HHB-11173 SS5]|uniref:uncharacterized protein n=1 Tax=Punctularia strigosozonata (strain HHB-11173) TaxID=741275 RepID=UPI0004417D45